MGNLFECNGTVSEAPDTITLTFNFSAKSNANDVITQQSYADFYTGEYTKCTKVTYSGDSSLPLYGVPSVGSITSYTTKRIGINAGLATSAEEFATRSVSITLAK